jgi:uncharacterized phage-associated protein
VVEHRFDREIFEELVLYIAWLMRDNTSFGRLKMAKALFYTDFSAYAEQGAALTWATYEHWQHGPFPPVLYDVERSLVQRGLAVRGPIPRTGEEARLMATESPRLRRLEGWQRHLAQMNAERVAEAPSWRVSDQSHEHPGWLVTRLREVIPYQAVYVPATGPTEHDVAEAEAVAREHGWL